MIFWQVYLRALRLPFLTGSLMPVAVAGALAYLEMGRCSLTLLGLTFLGVGALHSGANLLNDYYDSFGSDPINVHATPFSGGSRVIQEGGLTPATVRFLAFLFLGVGCVCGLALIFLGRPWVAVLGTLGLLAGYLYSAQPVQLMSAGLGEAAIFLAFGPLVTWGTYYVQTNALKPVGLAIGLPLAFLITAILWINEFPDLKADAAAGKRQLVVRLGIKKSRWVYAGLMLAPFPSLFFLMELFRLPDLLAAALVALPLTVQAIRIAFRVPPTEPEFIPAQARTIQTHVLVGLAMTLALLYAAWWR
ncbi:MAG: 1,4-dihydroxy-2-naphthoate octaprenyltransferase [Deltaproteobacteria bacterium]|nr:MAG: 1,4-dihydroxy-2-naphthoate octaprenyltransferase [Deltaproteobacteria bacterium]